MLFSKQSQRQRVINALRQSGEKGLTSFWGYRHFIPRMGAIVFNLRQEGYNIESKRNTKDAGCTYVLTETPTELLQHQALEYGIKLKTDKRVRR